jgi:aromatic-L-amino-acid/L-tryptophan decarboxylase
VIRRPEPVRDLDWAPERARELGGAVVDLWGELLERLPDQPVSRDFQADEVRHAVALEVPEQPLATEALLEHLRGLALERSVHIAHPGFLAYICGAGTVPGAAAGLVAGGINQNAGGWRLSPGASEVEQRLTRWLAGRFGLPEAAGGLMVSGGAMANLVALKLARDVAAGHDVRERGVRAAPPLAVYASAESHIVIRRAADILGLGSDAVREIPADARFRMSVEDLEAAIEEDLADGTTPAAIVATAGTTQTGSIDPLPEVAELCRRHGAWMHVDACYGGPAVLAEDLRPQFEGVEHARSIAVDPHKWMYTDVPGSCVLVRELESLSASFAGTAGYIWLAEESRQGIDLGQLGPEFSRGFSALKVWMSLLAHGREAYGRRISHDAELARYLGALVEERPDFELMAPVCLSVCCFRYAPPDLRGDEEALDRLNERIMTAIQTDGRTYCSNAVLDGRFCLRACVVNFRTEAEDIEALLEVASDHGERLSPRPTGEGLPPEFSTPG